MEDLSEAFGLNQRASALDPETVSETDVPQAGQLVSTLLLIMFVFATVGLHLFGGAITTDASGVIISRERAAALAASPFGAANYYPISFNDIPSGMVTLFEFLVVNKYDVRRAGSNAYWDQSHTGIKATLGSNPYWDQSHTGIKAVLGSKPHWE